MRLNQRTVYANSIPLDSKETYYRFRNTSGRFAIQKMKQNSDDVIFDTDELTEDIIDNSSKDQFNYMMREKSIENNVLVLEINNYGILTKKNFYNKEDMNDLKIAKATTQVGFERNSFIYDFMSSMRQKVNDPLGQRAKKRKEISQR